MRIAIILFMLVLAIVSIGANMMVSTYKGQHRKGTKNGYERDNTVHSSASLSELDFAAKENDPWSGIEWGSDRSEEGAEEDPEERQ